MAGTIYNVSTLQELRSALDDASGGDTVELAPGDYGKLDITPAKTFGIDARYDAPVTVTSADPEARAVISDLNISGAENLVFDKLAFKSEYSGGNQWVSPFEVHDSSHITFRNSLFEGRLAEGTGDPATDGFATGKGLRLKGGDHLTLEDNEFSTWHRGMVIAGVSDLVVTGNDVHSMRSDGMDFIRLQGALIEDNHVHDFQRSFDSSDHADMIQFWTNGTSAPTTDVTIRGNTLDIGEGGRGQSIFMRNEEVDHGRAGKEMFYRNIVIEENVIRNGHAHGISVGETDGLTIRNNSVLSIPGTDERLVGTPRISVAGASENVTIEGNVAANEWADDDRDGWHIANNVRLQHDAPDRPGYYGAEFVTSTLGEANAEALRVRPDSTIAEHGAGASRLLPEGAAPEGAAALHAPETGFTVASASDSESGQLIFEAIGGAGLARDGAYSWEFGDGSSATGRQVRHNYTAPGRYEARLEIAGPEGATATADATVTVAGAEILAFDPADGLFHTQGYGEKTAIGNSDRGSIEAGTGEAVDLGGEGVTLSIPSEHLGRFFGAESFEMSMTLTADALMGSAGEVARMSGNFVLAVDDSGAVDLRMSPSSGGVHLASTRIPVTDGEAHDVTIRLDGASDTLDLLIDGGVADSATVTGTMPAESNHSLLFGNAWGGKNFEGEMSAFRIAAPASDYPVAEGNLADLPESSTPPADDGDALTSPPDPEEGGTDAAAGGDAGETGDAITRSELGTAVRQHFDGTGEFADLGRIEAFEDSEQLSYEVTFHRDNPGAETERLVWNHIKTGLALEGDTLKVYANRAGTPFHEAFEIADAGVADTEQHTARVILDAEADRVQVILDDEVVLDDGDSDIDFVGAGGHEWGWMLGTPWNRYFEGEVSEFAVDDSAGFVEPDAPAAPFEGTLLVA